MLLSPFSCSEVMPLSELDRLKKFQKLIFNTIICNVIIILMIF